MSEVETTLSVNGDRQAPHVAILSSAGMGHLTLSARLAVALVSHGCLVTFIVPRPTVSEAESRHISALHASFPQIRFLDLHILPFDAPQVDDPFFRQFEAIRRSATLLGPLLASVTPPLSAILIDVSVLSAVLPVIAPLRLPKYVTFVSCAMMLALLSVLPSHRKAAGDGPIPSVCIPGVETLPGSWIPPFLHHPNHIFTMQFVENAPALLQVDGILITTFPALEAETLAALNAGAVRPGLPPVIAIGPQEPAPLWTAAPARKTVAWEAWLDAQPPRSVLYVAFGNRTAMSREQTRELGAGLESSGCRFLWVVKSKIVDREEDDGVELEELLGEGYLARVGERGMVVKSWVDQEVVLAHNAVGGFLSHGGWNSITEAALQGVRVLMWPGGGDQGVIALVAERCGAGLWVREWGWCGGAWRGAVPPVGGDEIGARVRELMGDAALGESVARIRKEAVRAVGAGGSSYEALRGLVADLAARGALEKRFAS